MIGVGAQKHRRVCGVPVTRYFCWILAERDQPRHFRPRLQALHRRVRLRHEAWIVRCQIVAGEEDEHRVEAGLQCALQQVDSLL